MQKLRGEIQEKKAPSVLRSLAWVGNERVSHVCVENPYEPLEGRVSSYLFYCLVAQMVKNLLAIQETWVQSLGQKDPLGREWLPTPLFLPGEIPWTEEPAGLQSMGLLRVEHG